MTRDIGDVKAFWEHHPGESVEGAKKWMRGHDGVGQPSRKWLLTKIDDGWSVLDVGCGPGVTYENLVVANNRSITYTGIDIADKFVQACRELFPEGDFRQASADDLPFEDNSYDVVVLRHVLEHALGYEREIAEAVRVARRRVVIVMWRPLKDGPAKMLVRDGDPENYRSDGSNDFNRRAFWDWLWRFGYPVRYAELGGSRPNWAWTIETSYRKLPERPAPQRVVEDPFGAHAEALICDCQVTVPSMDVCVFDLDDFWDGNTGWSHIACLKRLFPKLKVNLFAAPGRCSYELLQSASALPWVELCVHGWLHHPNTECAEWTKEMAAWALDRVEEMGTFAKVFRAPGWAICADVVEVLADRGYVIAQHSRQKSNIARTLGVDLGEGLVFQDPRLYLSHNPMMVHGHTMDINNDNPIYRNGIGQLMSERGFPWDEGTDFAFISEVT